MTDHSFELRPLPQSADRHIEHLEYERSPARWDGGALPVAQVRRESYPISEVGYTDGPLRFVASFALIPTGGGQDGDKPILYMGRERLQDLRAFYPHVAVSDVKLVARLIASPRAKDRNKGRRLARKRGWL